MKSEDAKEILTVARMLNKQACLLEIVEGKDVIKNIVDKFSPRELRLHPGILNGASCFLPCDEFEFTYSKVLPHEPAFIFFRQQHEEINQVIRIEDARAVSGIMEESYGPEYFLTNDKYDYLIAVNWYSVEGTGAAASLFQSLKPGLELR